MLCESVIWYAKLVDLITCIPLELEHLLVPLYLQCQFALPDHTHFGPTISALNKMSSISSSILLAIPYRMAYLNRMLSAMSMSASFRYAWVGAVVMLNTDVVTCTHIRMRPSALHLIPRLWVLQVNVPRARVCPHPVVFSLLAKVEALVAKSSFRTRRDAGRASASAAAWNVWKRAAAQEHSTDVR